LQELLKRPACSEADSASTSKHEGPVGRDAPDGTAVAGGLRSLVLIRLSACMFWHRFTKTAAGVSRYLSPGHSECGFPAAVSLCRPKGPANLVGMLDMSHITRRYHGSPCSTGQCSQWPGVHVCLRKRACSISQQSTIDACAPGRPYLGPLHASAGPDLPVRPRAQVRQTCYSRSPKNPALRQLQKSAKSASTTPQRPI